MNKERVKELAIGTKIEYPNAREIKAAIDFIKDNRRDIRTIVPDLPDFIEYVEGTSKSRSGEKMRIGEINRLLWKAYYDIERCGEST